MTAPISEAAAPMKSPMWLTTRLMRSSVDGGVGEFAISRLSASRNVPTRALRRASLTAQLSKMPSRSITNVRVPMTSNGAVPAARSDSSRLLTSVKRLSADPAGIW